jgi:CTP:molybdopterin cytidylyltransferase MocA
MTIAAVILAAGAGSRFHGPTHKLRAELDGRAVLLHALEAAAAAPVDDMLVVVGDDDFADLLPTTVTIVENPDWASGQASSLQAAVAHARSAGHEAVIVGVGDQPLVGATAWSLVAAVDAPIAVASFDGDRRPPVRIRSDVWDRLPTEGDEGARVLLRAHPELVTAVPVPGDATDIDTTQGLQDMQGHLDDIEAVTELLGRRPQGQFTVAVRGRDGGPIVLRNHPVLDDGRPMPTLYWLCGAHESMLVGRLESLKGVRRAEADLGLDVIAEAHDRYRAERDAELAAAGVQPEHRPTGGVGGTRIGVKCLHAHYGWWLAGGDDPVGQWVADHLHEVDHPNWPAPAPEETPT